GAQGAVDRVTIDADVRVHTIGETPALGICGSGLIDLLAGLLDAGVIDWTGLIRVEARDSLPPALRDRVAMRGEERAFPVPPPGALSSRWCEGERARADAIASRIEHVSLAAHPDFEQIFVDAMNFPRD